MSRVRCWSEQIRNLYLDWRDRGGPHDIKGRPLFSALRRKALRKYLPCNEAVFMIEACCALSDYDNKAEHAASARRVRELMKCNGVKIPRGKRSPAHLIALVEEVVPIAIWYGVPLKSGEGSRLVSILREVAQELGFEPDPRWQLRSLLQSERQERRTRHAQRQKAYEVVLMALLEGLQPDPQPYTRPNTVTL